ncbi:hypothetical protein C8J57DRAFT_1721435 [Mycena rebaudengoi]|nr:hypothetical protein C8J57DRAFT_1721435 [Mycena rebaudengoi]
MTKTEEWTLAVTKTTTEGTIGLTEIDSGLLAAYVDGNVAYHRPSSYPGCIAENTLPRAAGSPATTHFFSAHGPSTELGNLGTAPVFSRPIVPCGLFVTGLIYVLLAALAVFLARAYLRFLARAYLRTMAVFLDVAATCIFMLLRDDAAFLFCARTIDRSRESRNCPRFVPANCPTRSFCDRSDLRASRGARGPLGPRLPPVLARAYLRTMAVFLDVAATCRFMPLRADAASCRPLRVANGHHTTSSRDGGWPSGSASPPRYQRPLAYIGYYAWTYVYSVSGVFPSYLWGPLLLTLGCGLILY